MSNPLNWTQDQFYTFVLIHAAHADLEICDMERAYISKKHGKHILQEMEDKYFSMGEYERLEAILNSKPKHYSQEDDKKNILKEMEQMFHIDGAYSKLEKNLLLFFEKLL